MKTIIKGIFAAICGMAGGTMAAIFFAKKGYFRGPQGPTGPMGPMGPMGPAGPKGDRG
ncbi:hypothetical protein [Faecalibaculum rodentium]|uniref:hypothetical protein n=1 Tax=Faecalibaculum rodentium TaxID=1702221 RepID=UPI00272FCB9E|nr:hypothetical protein [Faecalibaculum rodentium]